jgi:subtilisin family serine protease
MLRLTACTAALLVLLVAEARAQAPPVRLAAAADCPQNINCIPGFKRVYGVDPTPFFVPLTIADAGIQALDDGIAEVAVAFSSNPQLSRPDILTLRDDRGMITPDHVVPVVRRSVLRSHGMALRRRLNRASRLLSTLELRGLNQQVIDGRLPEAVGGEFSDANGLGGPGRRRAGPRIVVGFQAFAENETLAYLYASALRGAGFRVVVRPAGGLRPETIAALRQGRIDMFPGYSDSLLGFLGGPTLKRALARIGARPLRRSPAQDRNGFAMKRDVAAALGIATLSELASHWPAVASTAGRSLSQEPGDAPVSAEGLDPLLREQWAFSARTVLHLPRAWELTRGAGVTVAIVDSGARLDHPDLAPNIWTNFGEVPGNGVDDDHNGYVDDVHGVDLTSAAPGQDISDGHGHGTHVAGIVGAAANGRGVVGVAPQVKLMIVKVLSASGAGTTGALAEGIRYAAANGARIINVSLGGDSRDMRVDAAVQAAGAANVLVVASAGNSSRDIDVAPNWPAAIAAPNLIAVAATDPEDGRAINSASNYGRLAVQLAAPGAEILSTANDGGYVLKTGTSMAAPMVAGVAALAASVNPGIPAADLRAELMQNAARSPLPVAAGYVDALQSVLAASVAVGYDTTQPPRVRILSATIKGRRTQVQAATLGSTAAIARYLVRLGRGKAVQLEPRVSPFSVTLRQRGRLVRIRALDAAGRTVAEATRPVVRLRDGKGDVSSGGGVGA